MSDLSNQLRRVCGHDSRSVEGCLHCEAADDIELKTRALGNCRLLAMKRLHKGAIELFDWQAILRFCTEAGCGPSPLRAEMETFPVQTRPCSRGCGKLIYCTDASMVDAAVAYCSIVCAEG